MYYFTKYYSFKTKEHIHKIVLEEKALELFEEVVNNDITDIDYSKLTIKKFSIEEEMKYVTSPNSIGLDAITKIKESQKKHVVIELTDNEFEELFASMFPVLLMYKRANNNLSNTSSRLMDFFDINKENLLGDFK